MKNKSSAHKHTEELKKTQPMVTSKVKTDQGKVPEPGISQPHNASKEALGPNTNR